MDIAFMPHLCEWQHGFLILMDMASDLTVAKYIMSSEGVRPPQPTAQRLQIDQGAAFRGDFSVMCEAMNIHLLPVPTGAHFSHGKVERRILTLKEMSSHVFHEMHVVDAGGARAAVPRMAEACNRLCNSDGFSPAQGALGDGVQLPGSAVDIDDPCASTHVPEGSAFWHPPARNSALRRAVLHQARPQPGPFETGSWIHYWRSRGGAPP